jgi:hypothetical protein
LLPRTTCKDMVKVYYPASTWGCLPYITLYRLNRGCCLYTVVLPLTCLFSVSIHGNVFAFLLCNNDYVY